MKQETRVAKRLSPMSPLSSPGLLPINLALKLRNLLLQSLTMLDYITGQLYTNNSLHFHPSYSTATDSNYPCFPHSRVERLLSKFGSDVAHPSEFGLVCSTSGRWSICTLAFVDKWTRGHFRRQSPLPSRVA